MKQPLRVFCLYLPFRYINFTWSCSRKLGGELLVYVIKSSLGKVQLIICRRGSLCITEKKKKLSGRKYLK